MVSRAFVVEDRCKILKEYAGQVTIVDTGGVLEVLVISDSMKTMLTDSVRTAIVTGRAALLITASDSSIELEQIEFLP